MAKTVKKYTEQDKRLAKKAGFRKKKPVLRGKKTYVKMESFIDRFNLWVDDLKTAAKKGRDMDQMKKAVKNAR